MSSLVVLGFDGIHTADEVLNKVRPMQKEHLIDLEDACVVERDKDGKVHVVTLADRKMVEIVDSPRGQIRDYTWSPRGNFLAFSMGVSGNGFSSVYVWNAADGKVSRVTDDMFNAYSPAWDPTGSYLYFLSDREFAPQISGIEFNYASNRDTYIYALALRKDVKHPFPPESDEVSLA